MFAQKKKALLLLTDELVDRIGNIYCIDNEYISIYALFNNWFNKRRNQTE